MSVLNPYTLSFKSDLIRNIYDLQRIPKFVKGQQIANIMILIVHAGGLSTTIINMNFKMIQLLGIIGFILAIISLKLNKYT